MSRLIKYYLDIGCSYCGEETIDNAYKDWHNWDINKTGLIGILKLEIDTESRTKKEIYFRQITSPVINKLCKYAIFANLNDDILNAFRKCGDSDLIVTWNGRDFDIPIIVNNLSSIYGKRFGQANITKDRDLLDICILKSIPVKGGLSQVAKRLGIIKNANKEIQDYDTENILFKGFSEYINKFNNNLQIIKGKNEFDVRLLPMLEEKLGYLYESRKIEDNYHKKWLK